MKKINLCAFLRKEAFFRLPERGLSAYTLAEIIVVMLIIAVIVAVTIGITKAKLDNIVSYTYYNAYSTLRSISTEMLADWDPQDPEYKQANLGNNYLAGFNDKIKNNISAFFRNFTEQPACAIGVVQDCRLIMAFDKSDCARQGAYWCNATNSCVSVARCCNNTPSGGGNIDTGLKCTPPYYADVYGKCVINCWDGSTATSQSACPTKVTCWDGSYTTNASKCPPKITCCDGSNKTDASQCPKQETCWDGSTVCGGSCPPKIGCCDGSYKTDASQCPKQESCWDGSTVCGGSCPPKITCWDGTNVTNESNCPGYVTCWDGNKAHNWSECPACTNKPSKLPCGQGWDEHTCQLTGTAKTCPSGQHLNSSCNCVNDCPSNLSPCNICSDETGIVSQNPAINRTCSDEAYEWSEEQCKCIVSPRTLPRKGENFCKLFERHANIMSGSSVCSGSVISNGTTDFSNKSPDITLRNGLRVYNMHSDAGAISMLANNTQGGVYDGVPNTNSYGYTVYVDIDGAKGDSQLWSDVYPFYITLSGKIIPAYDHSANPNGSGGDSVRHLQVSVENENYANGKRSTKWLAKSVPFKEGACIAGYVGDATPYCKNGTSFTKASECTTNYNSMCRVKQIQPVKFFF